MVSVILFISILGGGTEARSHLTLGAPLHRHTAPLLSLIQVVTAALIKY